jgi:lysozyme family protein
LDVADADITGDGHVDIDDIRDMSMEAALGFYKEHFWDHYNIHQFMVPALQRKMFSLLINMRGRTAMKCAQRALRSLGEPIVDDGYFGRKSLAAWNRVLSRQGASPLITSIRSEAAGVYRLIVKANPSQGVFLDGWLNRAYE